MHFSLVSQIFARKNSEGCGTERHIQTQLNLPNVVSYAGSKSIFCLGRYPITTASQKRELLRPNPQSPRPQSSVDQTYAETDPTVARLSQALLRTSGQRGLPTQNRSLPPESTGGADALAARKALPAPRSRLPSPRPGTIRTENRENGFAK